jgi:hypothetical protein
MSTETIQEIASEELTSAAATHRYTKAVVLLDQLHEATRHFEHGTGTPIYRPTAQELEFITAYESTDPALLHAASCEIELAAKVLALRLRVASLDVLNRCDQMQTAAEAELKTVETRSADLGRVAQRDYDVQAHRVALAHKTVSPLELPVRVERRGNWVAPIVLGAALFLTLGLFVAGMISQAVALGAGMGVVASALVAALLRRRARMKQEVILAVDDTLRTAAAVLQRKLEDREWAVARARQVCATKFAELDRRRGAAAKTLQFLDRLPQATTVPPACNEESASEAA